MNKITFTELATNMWDYNEKHPENEDKAILKGIIVYKQKNFEKPFSLVERSYEVANNNRCFQPNKISNSLFGNCLDGVDLGVRLDWYRWEVEYCYML